LEALLFFHCDLSELNLDDIGNCQKLHTIDCGGSTKLSGDEIRKLAVCPVEWFCLRNAHWNDSDLEGFTKLTKVYYLDLRDNTGITDAGFEYLEKIASLRGLRLTGTSVTREGVEEFQKKYPDVKVDF
jgi:hypothetical protein